MGCRASIQRRISSRADQINPKYRPEHNNSPKQDQDRRYGVAGIGGVRFIGDNRFGSRSDLGLRCDLGRGKGLTVIGDDLREAAPLLSA